MGERTDRVVVVVRWTFGGYGEVGVVVYHVGFGCLIEDEIGEEREVERGI